MGFLDRFRRGAASTAIVPSTEGPYRPVPVRASDLRSQRQDGWQNPATGIGTMRDKSEAAAYFSDPRISDPELAALYYGEDLANRIVNERVDQAFRRGYRIVGLEQEDIELLEEKAREIDLEENFKDAWRFGRLYGSSLLVLGALDGQEPQFALDEDNISSFAFLNYTDRRSLDIWSRYEDLLSPKFGEPSIYRVQPEPIQGGTFDPGYHIHESRCIRFDGIKTDRREANKISGWSYSVLQTVYRTLRQFGVSFESASILMQEASQGIFKVDGLITMIAGGEREQLLERMAMVDVTKSVARSIMVDADKEDYTRIAVSFAGIPDMLDRFMHRLCAATGMPATLLMGRSPAGLSATGESDFQQWYDSIATEQSRVLTPRLLRIYKLLCLSLGIDPTGLDIEWCPLEDPNPKEQAEIYTAITNADKINIEAGILDPAAVAIARFGKDKYDPFAVPKVNVAALEAELNRAPAEIDLEGSETSSEPSEGEGAI